MRMELKIALIIHQDDCGERQWQVANRIDKSENWLSMIIHEVRNPSPDDAEKLAAILGKTVQEIFPEMQPEQVA